MAIGFNLQHKMDQPHGLQRLSEAFRRFIGNL
ncbi:hypothetical protein SDC9_198376 [bioreactor metagenome]|uniref:Uncharacterized protein n=1 Tax=bioreactor metagenome TaxID=1076179 RepID=A0A645IUC4_9ZZZZ